MKVSSRVEYGLIALTDIVIHGENGETVSAPEIAERENISHKYLEQILLMLRQAGFITAQKGIRGGYSLACSQEKVSLSDVLNALDSNILADVDDGRRDETGLYGAVNDCLWDKINESLNRYSGSLKLSDFANQCRSKITSKWDMYVI